MFIYRLTDNTNGNIYIGQCVNLNTRIRQHIINPAYVSAKKIIENGDFNFKIIEECDDKLARVREQYWIDHTDCINERNPVRKITKKEYNRQWTYKVMKWRRSFGDERYYNCLCNIDPSIFS
mgnify:CR=1 FL=1|tara:strand:- start:2599 stop:2964 length:366 start_codon:yes stop_codon:yes gene_type:complete